MTLDESEFGPHLKRLFALPYFVTLPSNLPNEKDPLPFGWSPGATFNWRRDGTLLQLMCARRRVFDARESLATTNWGLGADVRLTDAGRILNWLNRPEHVTVELSLLLPYARVETRRKAYADVQATLRAAPPPQRTGAGALLSGRNLAFRDRPVPDEARTGKNSREEYLNQLSYRFGIDGFCHSAQVADVLRVIVLELMSPIERLAWVAQDWTSTPLRFDAENALVESS